MRGWAIEDRKQLRVYGKAIAESGLYRDNGGYYEAVTPALEVLEGSPPATRGVIIARFTCLAAARRFCYSDVYQDEMRALRNGIAEFELIVLPAPPLPEWAP